MARTRFTMSQQSNQSAKRSRNDASRPNCNTMRNRNRNVINSSTRDTRIDDDMLSSVSFQSQHDVDLEINDYDSPKSQNSKRIRSSNVNESLIDEKLVDDFAEFKEFSSIWSNSQKKARVKMQQILTRPKASEDNSDVTTLAVARSQQQRQHEQGRDPNVAYGRNARNQNAFYHRNNSQGSRHHYGPQTSNGNRANHRTTRSTSTTRSTATTRTKGSGPFVLNNVRNMDNTLTSYYNQVFTQSQRQTVLNYSHLTISLNEPRMFFHESIRRKYMVHSVIGYNTSSEISESDRVFYINLSKVIAKELYTITTTTPMFNVVDYDFKAYLQRKHFDFDYYHTLPGTSARYLYKCFRDFCTCCLDGIPVVKVPKPLYDYFSVLPLEDQYYHKAERVYFDSDNQTKRIKFILIDHVVYHAINLDVRAHWRQYSQTVINALKVCQEKEFPSATTQNVSPYPTYEMLKRHLIASGFPYDEYFSLEYINERKVLDMLADFAYCIHCKIEKFKLWDFSNEAIIRDHSNGRGWFHVDPSSHDEEMDQKKESIKKTDVSVENSNTNSEFTKSNTVDTGTKFLLCII